jgi:RNA polymerase sigma-70 factor (ECF subfamily)
VYRFALRLAGDPDAALDIAQETMLRAWRRRKRLRDPRAAKRWLLTIATNIWRDQLRRKRVSTSDAMPDAPAPPGCEAPVSQALTHREAVELVERRMARLPPRQRQVLYLRAFEELSIEEIAGVLSINVNAVKASLALGRRTLRRELSEYDPGRRIHR